jgi:hypothetical protein
MRIVVLGVDSAACDGVVGAAVGVMVGVWSTTARFETEAVMPVDD